MSGVFFEISSGRSGWPYQLASPGTHFFIGACLALPAVESRFIRAVLPSWRIPIYSGLLASLPDLDIVIPHLLGHPVGGFFRHRGFFHAPFFLFLVGTLLAALVTRVRESFLALSTLWTACMITHPLLDAMPAHGAGLMLLVPLSTRRIFFPWRPLDAPPVSARVLLKNPALLIQRPEMPWCAAAAAIGLIGWLAVRWWVSFKRQRRCVVSETPMHSHRHG
jgi:inner membrane protein